MDHTRFCDISTESCTSFIDCTGSNFIPNWTEICCQPESVKSVRFIVLPIIGIVGVIGIISNLITISTFLYLYFFQKRIKTVFKQEFSIVKDPIFFFLLHLSVCDLLYCFIGLPTYWDVFFYGYYPYSHKMCMYFASARNTIGKIK